MIYFFQKPERLYAVKCQSALSGECIDKLRWLFSGAEPVSDGEVTGTFIGPRREMVTPWSTNAVEITQNMGIDGIERIEEFTVAEGTEADPMLNAMYVDPGQDIFEIDVMPEPVRHIEDISQYNQQEGLALSQEEIDYLNDISQKIGRPLTDSEVFGFSQVNSEHCRHKIFNGRFIIDGEEKPESLFSLIKKTTAENNNRVVSAYKDNCAFLEGPSAEQFAPLCQSEPEFFSVTDYDSVISLKAETHNFPTTVEPFNGAATGTGGEIRDRIAGGKASFPIAGTAVYMTSYPRTEGAREWEGNIEERPWLYRTPADILVKASNGASDFGNKFGQPLICGSVLTFEHEENEKKYGYDKVIMQAGGIGYGKKEDSLKDEPSAGNSIVILGGDNYRIGMGGGAVSSVATGEFANAIELNAVQRSNPEMQKRVYNAIRALSEEGNNPIISIHDHGAGGHLNCLSELVEATGGKIEIDKLPVGDKTLSAKEIVGNESQERMGLVVDKDNLDRIRKIAERERAPFYSVGETTGDMRFTFLNNDTAEKAIDLPLEYMFGKPPRTVMQDKTINEVFAAPVYDKGRILDYIEQVLQLEAVACKDWLTNKVDRSVTGRIALQQTSGTIQLPINDCAITAMDYTGRSGIATSIGHAPIAALADPAKGSRLAIGEALTNLALAPLAHGLQSVSLSANWMWPCRNEGEDARLYSAVQAASEFALALGINIPTGKDSLSMTQKYPDGEKVISPGTVIISSVGETGPVNKAVYSSLQETESDIIYVDMSLCGFEVGGSSLGQILNAIGNDVPDIADPQYFGKAFTALQTLVNDGKVLSGHDVSAGGLVTALLEMTFCDNRTGIEADIDVFEETDPVRILFSEKPGIILQVKDAQSILNQLHADGITAVRLGRVNLKRQFVIAGKGMELGLAIDSLRDTWYRSSFLLDKKQSGSAKAAERYANYKTQDLSFIFPTGFKGSLESYGIDPNRRECTGIKAAIIREKGVNGDREMAWAMHLAGMDVKDVHMTDLISGREDLTDVNMIVFVGGFSNSDVLGSAKGWAGAFLYNEKAKRALDNFYAREDTLSLGVCNGCQLMIELGLINPTDEKQPRMLHNESGKFESEYINVNVEPTNSIMFSSLAGSRLGIWIAHGEGKFSLPYDEGHYNVALKYSYSAYPGNPNGSDHDISGICSNDGRHLAMMPHLERTIRPWNCPSYPGESRKDDVTPWFEAFVNAAKWIKKHKK